MKIFQLKSQSFINNFINPSPINKFINEITSALDKIPENRNKCESEKFDYNNIYTLLPKCTLSQFNNNMKVSLDEQQLQHCKECGQELNSQSMSMHYKNHYDSLKKNMANNNLLRLVSLRAQKVNESNQRRLALAKKNNSLTAAKKSKLVSLLTLRGKIVKQNNEKLVALVTLRGKIMNQNNEKRQAAIVHKLK